MPWVTGECLPGRPAKDGSYGPLAVSFYRGVGKESFSAQEAELLSYLASHLTVAARNYWAAQTLRLVAGDDLLEAAAALRISIHTARAQLKSVFRNTGRRSQGQLLMLAARLALATLSSTPT